MLPITKYFEPPQKEYSAINKKHWATKVLSITFRYACGYCFDLMLCEKIDFMFKEVN